MLTVAISRWGSAGDVFPYIGLGWALARRGHAVTFIGNPHYREDALGAGLDVLDVGTPFDHQRLLDDDGIWDRSRKSPDAIYREHYYPLMARYYEAVLRVCATGNHAIVVGGEAASAVAAEKLGLPLVYLACSPASSRFTQSRFDPPHPERVLPVWAQWVARSEKGLALLWALSGIRHRRKRSDPGPSRLPRDHPLALLRSAAGLPPAPDRGPATVICLWPGWFASPQRDWPAGTVVTDFPYYPRPSDSCRTRSAATAMTAPIVVTTGSVAGRQARLYQVAVEACRAGGRAAVLVTPHREDIPADLPDNITHLTHAAFSDLFAQASLVVHHGGIGTVAYAIAAGVPQIAVPMRGDQFDNANRLQRLGIGRMLSKDTSPAHLARTIDAMLRSRRVARRCRYWQTRIDPNEGLQRAATAIESLVPDA